MCGCVGVCVVPVSMCACVGRVCEFVCQCMLGCVFVGAFVEHVCVCVRVLESV